MKKILSIILLVSVFIAGCSSPVVETDDSIDNYSVATVVDITGLDTANYINGEVEELGFSSMSDPDLVPFIEDAVYCQLVDELGDDMYIENVSAIYISQEYIDELTYNSQANIFFGYTLQELEDQFQGERYVFTVEDGQTVVQLAAEYDDTYDQILRNVAIGTGVILVCVTVSVVTAGAGAPAASAIFAVAARTGTIMGLSYGAIGGAATGLITGVTTGDWDQALDEGLLAGSEGFMMGAICGSVVGGAGEAITLHGMTLNGLTMDEAAIIQHQSGYSPELISRFRNFQEYEAYRDAGLAQRMVGNRSALIRNIDPYYISPTDNPNGYTNLELMLRGNAPFDPNGVRYELHHIGQNMDSPLAILTQAEHDLPGLHIIQESQINRAAFAAERQAFWQAFGRMTQSAMAAA